MDSQKGHLIDNFDLISSCTEQISLQNHENCLFCNRIIGFNFPIMIHKALCTKYSFTQNILFTQQINDIIQERTTALKVKLDEDQIWDEEQEFLKRFYQQIQWTNKIKILSQYYKYHIDVPKIYTKYICVIFNDYHDQRRQFDYKRLKKFLKELDDSQTFSDTKNSKIKYSMLLEDLKQSMEQFEKKKNQQLKCELKKLDAKDTKIPDESTLLDELMTKLNEITKFQTEKNITFSFSELEHSKNFIELQGKERQEKSMCNKGSMVKKNYKIENMFKNKKGEFNDVKNILKIKNIDLKSKTKKVEIKNYNHKTILTNFKEDHNDLSKQLTNRLSDEILKQKKFSLKKFIFQKQKKTQPQENKKLICNAKINIHINNALFLTNQKKKQDCKEQNKRNLESLVSYQKKRTQLFKTIRKPCLKNNKQKDLRYSLEKINMEQKNILKKNQNINIQKGKIKKKIEDNLGTKNDFRIVEKKIDEFSDRKIIRKSSQNFNNTPLKSKSVTMVKKVDTIDFSKKNSQSIKNRIALDDGNFKEYISEEIRIKNWNFLQHKKQQFSKKIDQILSKKLVKVDTNSIYRRLKKQ